MVASSIWPSLFESIRATSYLSSASRSAGFGTSKLDLKRGASLTGRTLITKVLSVDRAALSVAVTISVADPIWSAAGKTVSVPSGESVGNCVNKPLEVTAAFLVPSKLKVTGSSATVSSCAVRGPPAMSIAKPAKVAPTLSSSKLIDGMPPTSGALRVNSGASLLGETVKVITAGVEPTASVDLAFGVPLSPTT